MNAIHYFTDVDVNTYEIYYVALLSHYSGLAESAAKYAKKLVRGRYDDLHDRASARRIG